MNKQQNGFGVVGMVAIIVVVA
ncbi:MAG: hypothetical protein QG549_977, partial [Patescibacteria group bacterium]|nr:hypothetical protein [Patescibacteria group bacterium]